MFSKLLGQSEPHSMWATGLYPECLYFLHLAVPLILGLISEEPQRPVCVSLLWRILAQQGDGLPSFVLHLNVLAHTRGHLPGNLCSLFSHLPGPPVSWAN